MTATDAVRLDHGGVLIRHVRADGPRRSVRPDRVLRGANAESMGMSYDDVRTMGVSRSSVNPPGLPEDVAHEVCCLVGDGAGHVSGQVVHVAGGALS